MREQIQAARLYGILDLDYVAAADAVEMTTQLVAGGVDILQLRAKNASLETIESVARETLPIARAGGIPFILNDFPELAVSLGVDGVHVGQDDGEMDAVRAIVGDEMIVGRSTHSPAQAAAAANDPRTDYIGFGPLFPTMTKPGRPAIGIEDIRHVHEAHPGLPIFCIGGVKLANLAEVTAAGARRVVIVSEILQAPDVGAHIAAVKAALDATAD